MAITHTLKTKYPNWTQEDWDRFHWINSWDRRRRNLASLLPCKRCGAAAIFEEDHGDMPYHNMFTLGCPKCHRYLETTTDFSRFNFGVDSATRNALFRWYKIGCLCTWCGNGIFTILPSLNTGDPARDIGGFLETQSTERLRNKS
jgi:hypothetical protein